MKISSVVSLFLISLLTAGSVTGQNDSMYIMRSGAVIGQFKLAEIDSIVFYKPGPGTSFQCGDALVVSHVAGLVAPVNKSTTYSTVTNIPGEVDKCWITSNLGSDRQATAKDDASEASAGWYWQFNRKQGFRHDGLTLSPSWSITWIDEISDWLPGNDPCSLELGPTWRIPSFSEWQNIDLAGEWTNLNGPWNSDLKLHASGFIGYIDGSLNNRGLTGAYWSAMQNSSWGGDHLTFDNFICETTFYYKAMGFNVRCVTE